MSRILSLSYSPDGGHNWVDTRQIDMGSTGSFNKVLEERRFGRGTEWIFDISISDNVPVDLLDASWQAEVGR
jgi:hypothetical protein